MSQSAGPSWDELHIFKEILMVNATTWDMADELIHHFGLERIDVCPIPLKKKDRRRGFNGPRHSAESRFGRYQRRVVHGRSGTK